LDNPTFNVNEDIGDGTALHFACCFDRHDVVSVLLARRGINVNLTNILGQFVVVSMEKSKL
jgi:hypothetical protein